MSSHLQLGSILASGVSVDQGKFAVLLLPKAGTYRFICVKDVPQVHPTFYRKYPRLPRKGKKIASLYSGNASS